jgi:hypothetical protein
MNIRAKLARASLFVTLCALSAFGAAWRYSASGAQEYAPSLIELRADSLARVGETLVVDVYANIAVPTYGFGLQVAYDATVVQLETQQDSAGAAVPLRVGGGFAGAQRIRNTNEIADTSGLIDVVYTLLPPAEPAQGEGFIGRLQFLVLQDAPVTLELVSPRLIALEDGSAVDLPVTAGQALALTPEAAAAPVVVDAPQQLQTVTAPVAAVPVAQQPLVESLTSVNTSDDVLSQMSRTNELMNTVLIGLLAMVTLLFGLISITTLADAFSNSRAPRPVPVYAGRPRPAVAPARARAAQPQRQQLQRPVYMDSGSAAKQRLAARRQRMVVDTQDL